MAERLAQPQAHPTQPGRTWRVTTAARVFVIAVALGQSLSSDQLGSAGTTLVALATLAAVTSALEFDPLPLVARWIPVAEGVLAVVLISIAGALISPLLVYLVVPPVVAGVRHGYITAANTTLVMGTALLATSLTADSLGTVPPSLGASIPWLALGLGAGLLAAWQTRSVRALEETQGAYVAAHRLLTQLRNVSSNLVDGLESRSVADRLTSSLLAVPGVTGVSILVGDVDRPLKPFSQTAHADFSVDVLHSALECRQQEKCLRRANAWALPLRVGDRTFGVVLVAESDCQVRNDIDELLAIVDEHALRLDTALLFDEVRAVATTEERHRLAREIHDGVAQDVASLGYLVDDLATSISDPTAREAARALRDEVSRVLTELRLSIFDLRQGIGANGGLAGALTEYVRRVSSEAGLRAHVQLDVKQDALDQTASNELLRIGQEAVTNVRKHADAENLWVRLAMDGTHVVLKVEDDGIGPASPRAMHYGLPTMRERAARVGARFEVTGRPNGGTIVTVETLAAATKQDAPEGVHDGHQRLAGG